MIRRYICIKISSFSKILYSSKLIPSFDFFLQAKKITYIIIGQDHIKYIIFDHPLVVELSLAALKPLWKLLHLKRINWTWISVTQILKGCYEKKIKSVITSFKIVVDFIKAIGRTFFGQIIRRNISLDQNHKIWDIFVV